MLQIGEYPGPVKNAAFSPPQALLRFLELALCIAQTLTLGSVELWVYGQQRLKPECPEYYG
jgi:hypothetical protein